MMKDLETKNLKIRKFKIEDAEDIYKYLATEERLADCLGYHVHKSIDETRHMISSYINEYEMNELVWAIEEKHTNIVIGYINAFETSRKNKRCEIKFGIGLNWCETGYMEEALERVLEYLFEEEKFEIVISKFCDGHKQLSQIKSKMLENVGMIREAILRNRKINEKTGKAENMIVYSIILKEYNDKLSNMNKVLL